MNLPSAWLAPLAKLEKFLLGLFPDAALREACLRQVKRLGPLGGAGLALLIVALLVDIGGTLANFRVGSALTAERQQLERRAAAGGEGAAAARGEAASFYARFPEQAALPRSLAKISEIAAANGLNIARADYRAVEQPGTQLVRMSLSLPVQGSYAAIHAWLAETLETMPEVALDSLALHRSEPAADRVEGEVRMTLFARRT